MLAQVAPSARTAGSGATAAARSAASRLSIAAAQATAVSAVSHGRQTSRFGIRRSDAACSIDWCVGPSSPRPIESCVKTWIDALLHQRRHADRVAAVVAEGEEGAAVRDEAAVQRDAVHDRGHAELAHAVVDVAAAPAVGVLRDAPSASKRSGGVCLVLVRFEPVRSAEPPSSSGSARGEGLERELARLAAWRRSRPWRAPRPRSRRRRLRASRPAARPPCGA